jgi:ADP-heptose:LPS heptosyltransferase
VPKRAVFIGYNALGDTLCSTAVIRGYRRANPETCITCVVQDVEYCRLLEADPDIDTVLYSEVMYSHGLKYFSMEWLMSLAIDTSEETPLFHFDMNRLAGLPNVAGLHIAEGFSETLSIPIDSTRPEIQLTTQDVKRTRHFIQKPYVVLSMHSVTNPARADGREGGVKDWPWQRWSELAILIRRKYDLDVIALGSERNMRPQLPGIRMLYGLPIRTVAAMIAGAQCMISLENGLAHLAAGLDAPLVHLYSPLVPLTWAQHKGLSNYEFLYRDPHEIEVEEAGALLESVLARQSVAA